MAGLGDAGGTPIWRKRGSRHLANELVFGTLVEVGRELFALLHFRRSKWPVWIRCHDRVCRNVSEVALLVWSVERLEAFTP